MAPRPGLDVTATSSSSLSSFPQPSASQRGRIERTLAHLPHDASTWADLTQAQQRILEAGEDGDEDGMYELWLKLVWQEGVTWHDKWAAVQRTALGEHPPEPPRRHHRRRPSDNLDLLRRKLDRVALDPPAAKPAERSKSTPPRPLLVRRPLGGGAGGYSSSDDHFAGVPTPRARRSSLLEARLEARRRPLGATTTDDDALGLPPRARLPLARSRPLDGNGDALASGTPAPLHSTPAPPRRHSASTPRPILPLSPPPPAPLSPSRHPLLHARLSALPPPAPTPPPTSLEVLAASFSRLRLLLPAFSHWSAVARFHAQRESDLTQRRAAWLMRCALRSWRARLSAAQALGARATDVAAHAEERRALRAARAAFGAWRSKRLAREVVRENERRADERHEKERALREARNAVDALAARGCARRTLERWRERARESRAGRFRVLALGRGALDVWRGRAARRAERSGAQEDLAADQWAAWEARRGREVWAWWLRRTAWKVAERELVRRKDNEVRRETWEVWSDKKRRADHEAYLASLASSHHARRLAGASLSTWRARFSHVSSLATLSAAHSHTLLTRRASASLHTWRLRTRLSLLSRSRAHTLAASALTAWVGAYEHLEIELAGRADALLARTGAQLRVVAISAWADAAAQRVRLARAAEGVDRARLLRGTLARWRTREGVQRVQERKADVVRDFMQVRGAWRKWCEVAWERRRARWEESRRKARQREALAFWLAKTRQKLRDERLIAQVQEKQALRLRSDSLQAWKSRVIARKSLEQDASAFFDRKGVLSGFQRWTEQTYRAADRLVLADEHRAVRLEELRDRAFHAWLATTRRCSALNERLAAFTVDRDRRTTVLVFDAWREKSLQHVERQVLARRRQREKAVAWSWWKGRTKTLTAVQHYNRVLALRSLQAWRFWTTPPEMALRAVETDHGAITSGALQVWRIKTGAKRALKSLSGRMRLGTSPGSSPPALRSSSPRLSVPTSSPSSSAASARALSSSTRSTTTAATPLRISPSLDTSLASTTPTSYRPSAPSSLASPLARPSRSPAPTRPRLAAEYVSPALDPAPASRASLRPRSRSIASRLSAGGRSARSLPGSGGGGGGGGVSSDDEDEDERREATRSEGARERDVRGEYAVLRARLRAAAVAAKGR